MTVAISHDSETPAHGQQVITACAFIHDDFDGVRKVFLPRRADTKKFLPGVYELPGGHVDFGEDLVEDLKREIFEEFGTRINVGDPFAAFTYLNNIKGSHSVEVVYFARFADDITNIKLSPEDHSDYGWFSEDELDRVITPNKSESDPEMRAIRKGFALLGGVGLEMADGISDNL
ncbi:MAG: NUDIX hydrolase [bacterium]|nr:NUDIX hydrolase [bacterium]MDZ4296228.1 NUDIX hydrolase [Patescibacteria group bacterium]